MVSRRKLALLTRATSVGPPSDATDADGNRKFRSTSTQASPMVKKRSITMPVNMIPRETNSREEKQIGRIRDMDDPSKAQPVNEYNAECQVTTNTNSQWQMLAQQTAAIASTDFANQTKALQSGLTRAQK